MDKNRAAGSSKCLISETSKKSSQGDVSGGKQWPKSGRRREPPINSNTKSDQIRNNKSITSSKSRPIYDNKRPRQRSGYHGANGSGIQSSTGLDETDCPDAELNSVFLHGSKKQNLNHLLNFHYTPRDKDPAVFSRTGNNRGYVKKIKYNKEQFLQANCQFVVKSDGDYSAYAASPDTLVAWKQIEQIHIQSSEDPQCPICLYHPVAGKMTRCGHVFCFPCILHYLALSDKSWRKCPICYESVHTKDLKSAISQPHRSININDVVTLQLMRREKGTLNVQPSTVKIQSNKIPHLSDSDESAIHSKLLLANLDEIMSIIERERNELLAQMFEDGEDCPESCFVQQALEMLLTRQNEIFDVAKSAKSEQATDLINEKLESLSLQSSNETPVNEINDPDFVIDQETSLTLEDINIVPCNDLSNYFYFFQSDDGQHLYLNSINVRMLQSMYGSLEKAPNKITGRILQKESLSMTDDLRRRLKYLQHLPVTCQFDVVEIQMNSSMVSDEVIDKFKDELASRKKMRQHRAREERIREKHIFEVNERQLGKVLASSANIDIGSTSHFPTVSSFENDPSLLGTSFESELAISPGCSNNSAPSFANMLNQTPIKHLWPTLSSPLSPMPQSVQKVTQITGSNLTTTIRQRQQSDSDYGDDMEETARAPEFRQSFSNAIAQALEAVASKGGSGAAQPKGKKKKNKKTVLFSTGMAFNGN